MKVLFFENKFFPKGKQGSKFDQDFFFASGVNHGGEVHCVPIPGSTFTDLNDWVAKSFGDTQPKESDYVLGTFYKRMWRPVACGGRPNHILYQEKLNESFVSLRILLTKLENLFETIEPNKDNLLVYGHKIREVILLACMEVESSLAAVLKENAYISSARLTTNDYVKLLAPMFLDAYQLSLQSYPSFPSFTPFAGWDLNNPTTSLGWYDAYNKTKHDREENLKSATLENAVYAVGASVVMFHAQFGLNFGTGFFDQKSPLIRNIFRIITKFEKYEKEFYIPKFELQSESGKASPMVLDWTALNYQF
jgi:hypothetical protein